MSAEDAVQVAEKRTAIFRGFAATAGAPRLRSSISPP
jgi:hypothetical protein